MYVQKNPWNERRRQGKRIKMTPDDLLDNLKRVLARHKVDLQFLEEYANILRSCIAKEEAHISELENNR